ncbi:MAG: proline--tRNA ligase, partial [Candidatus Omnitrophica bacterium]|nr:proline--tRNA ligase [Candidatus Omnitrophota bacterium]
MFYSKSFIFTSKESPAEAEIISHQLMLRSCLIKKISSGVYAYLPLGLRVLKKVKEIIREEMNKLGGQELMLSALQPFSIWKKSERDAVLGKIMISFTNRHKKQMVLGPTHEEIITDIVSSKVNSYKNLPLILYQIQTKFRDEIRPRYGIVRGCEFTMKDAYSFDKDEQGLAENYEKMKAAYHNIFSRCGLSHYKTKETDPEMMGGDLSHEFLVSLGSAEEIELGHIFKLGTKYSKVFNANYCNERGERKTIVMGCYGIGVDRIIAACIEKHHDKQGIIWPISISPYPVLILPLDYKQTDIADYTNLLYQALLDKKIDSLVDDRSE